jgi:hypothetical protein
MPSSPDAPPGEPTPSPTPAPDATPPPGGAAPGEGEAARASWIAEVIILVGGQDEDIRREALRRLLQNDKDGDCVRAILARLPDLKKDVAATTDVVRALGRPGLEAAVPALVEFLDAKDDPLRADAAVSLEYVGSKTAAEALLRAAPREKDEAIANHMYRALGRCAPGDEKARDALVKRANGAKSEVGSLGPIIGLAYFEKDAKAARDVEKLIVKEGVGPPGRRGGGQGAAKRTLLLWTLAEIGDPKSGKFVREKVMAALNENNPWSGAIMAYYEAVVKKLDGDGSAMSDVVAGVERTFGFVGGNPLNDAARKGRDDAGFTPKGEFASAGGGGGRGPPTPPAGGPGKP